MSFITCSQGHQNPAAARFCSYCGEFLQSTHNSTTGVATSQTQLQPGTKLRDRYIIHYQLGQGGFGRTYLARDINRFNESVVIKELIPLAQGTYNLHKAEELFEREAAMLHKLKHPQIPHFWEFFREGQQLFIVQDYIQGQTYQSLLNRRLQRGECFSEAEIIQLFRQLLPVLSYLHHQGIIHRDIAPDNIICRDSDKLPVLIDLGGVKRIAINVAQQLAGGLDGFSSDNATRLGKVGYAPDEQIRMGIVAPYSDLYALGVTAIVLMTGKQPQESIDPQTMNWIWDKHLPSLSRQLKEILSRMLAAKPYERFQSAEEILEILETGHSSAQSSRLGAVTKVKTVLANNSGQ
ncbi:protein kinase, partial [Planktothrix sp. FACHB-1355]